MTVIADEAAFAASAEPHRRELHVHCYRMLGSFDEAEDAVQETFLRAWRSRDTFDGVGVPGVALPDRDQRLPRPDPAQQSPPRRSLDSLGEVPWLQPYPDQLLDEVAPREDEPDAVVVQRETIELAFLAAIQLLPPRQRAVLILRDVARLVGEGDRGPARHDGCRRSTARSSVRGRRCRRTGRTGGSDAPPRGRDRRRGAGAARALDRGTRGG